MVITLWCLQINFPNTLDVTNAPVDAFRRCGRSFSQRNRAGWALHQRRNVPSHLPRSLWSEDSSTSRRGHSQGQHPGDSAIPPAQPLPTEHLQSLKFLPAVVLSKPSRHFDELCKYCFCEADLLVLRAISASLVPSTHCRDGQPLHPRKPSEECWNLSLRAHLCCKNREDPRVRESLTLP